MRTRCSYNGRRTTKIIKPLVGRASTTVIARVEITPFGYRLCVLVSTDGAKEMEMFVMTSLNENIQRRQNALFNIYM
jgi:hypothetical protein